jgi:hypothetical protein
MSMTQAIVVLQSSYNNVRLLDKAEDDYTVSYVSLGMLGFENNFSFSTRIAMGVPFNELILRDFIDIFVLGQTILSLSS